MRGKRGLVGAAYPVQYQINRQKPKVRRRAYPHNTIGRSGHIIFTGYTLMTIPRRLSTNKRLSSNVTEIFNDNELRKGVDFQM